MIEKKNEIKGVIFPLNQDNFDLLLKREKPVYVKYNTHLGSKSSLKLKEGHMLFFFLSNSNRRIIGFSKILSVSLKSASNIKKEDMDRIQMSELKFDRYISSRENKPLMLLELEKINRLDTSIDFPITMSGKFIDEDIVKKLIPSIK